MAKQTPNNDKRVNSAVLFTAAMGALVGVVAIYANQYGDSSLTDALRFIAITGTMLGGVVSGLLFYSSNNK